MVIRKVGESLHVLFFNVEGSSLLMLQVEEEEIDLFVDVDGNDFGAFDLVKDETNPFNRSSETRTNVDICTIVILLFCN